MIHERLGILRWNSLCDATGKTPFSYAAIRNTHAYNNFVARKIADKRNNQASLNIDNEIANQLGLSRRFSSETNKSSCAPCATVALKYRRKASGSHCFFPTPIIHSMLVNATVCVSVCIFMHASQTSKKDLTSVGEVWIITDKGNLNDLTESLRQRPIARITVDQRFTVETSFSFGWLILLSISVLFPTFDCY